MKKYNFKKIIFLLIVAVFACGTSDLIVTVPSDLSIGEPYKIKILGEKAKIKILTPNSTEEFYFILYTSENGKENKETTIEGNIIQGNEFPVLLTKSTFEPDPNLMDSFLRNIEKEALQKMKIPGRQKIMPKLSGSTPPPRANFKVLNSYFDPKSYTEVEATLVSLSANSAFYVDNETPLAIKNNEAFPPAIQRLHYDFDNILAPINRFYFGEESNIDDIPQIIILITPVVNSINTGGLGGVLGFFFSGDLLSAGDYPSSNETEIFFTAIPENAEDIGFFIDKVLHGTLAHEFQHMINFNQHSLMNGSESNTEEIWLNEGLSHLAEDLTGYGTGNIGMANFYLYYPKKYPLVTSSDSAGTRGASFLFLKYLHDRFDSTGNGGLLRKITGNHQSGIKNIRVSLDSEFLPIYEDWITALALSNTGISNNPDYNYTGVSIRGENNLNTFHSPKMEEFGNVNIGMKPTSVAFYNIKARNHLNLDIEIKIKNNYGTGVIIIPTRK